MFKKLNLTSLANDPEAPKLFSKPGVVMLYLGIVGVFFALQLLGIYLFAPVVFDDFILTTLERFGKGSFDGTVTSYSMIFTLITLLSIIFGIIKWRLASVSDQINSSKLGEITEPFSKTSYKVSDYLALRPFPLYVAMGFIGLWLLFTIGTETLTYILDKNPTAFVDDLYDSVHPKWLLIIAMVIVAPIYEEVMFRGILWRAVKEQFDGTKGFWMATIVTSVLFSIIHLQYEFYEMSVVFVLALLLSFARAKSGSLYLPILIHMINNGIAMWMYLIIS
ncbi:CPBP family intramembrane glutamic endopeptidase [Psychrobacter sp.]|uniref:CPBP family intramembrane glutamic endopeptidase n=1 Tax=Psychrobacter sp. TaxID=56811 RepID=UPI0025FA88D9|nr:CPBP family intramembrane glutamic endopeptidase [Psychrobacter sp.]